MIKEFKPREAQHSTDEVCASPIVIRYWEDDDHIISLSFHLGYFNTQIVEYTLKRLGFAEENNWELRKLTGEQSSAYATYLLVLLKDYGEQREEALNAIVGRIVKEVYSEEMNFWNDEIEVKDLTRPHSYGLSDGANISRGTFHSLLFAGIKTIEDLTDRTREEICRIPNMTTGDVVRIEKSLISRGLSLKTEIPSHN